MNALVLIAFFVFPSCILAGHSQQGLPAGGRVAAKEAGVGTLVDVLVGSDPEFTTLVAAVKAADLVGTLSGAGPFTVLAPNNAAFAKIDKDALNALLADKEALTKVLLRHVIAAKVESKDVTSGPVETVGGAESLAIVGILVVSSLLAKRFYFSGGKCRSKNRLDGKVTIITGANTGIGYETALDFAKRGATVILACRDLKRAQNAADKIIEQTNNTKIEVEYIDLADLKTVKEFAERMNKRLNRLDLLINNAGVMQCPYWKTADGFEMQFGVNHLAHFLLTNLLINLLKKQASRVVNVSSIAHVYGKIKWDDINCELEKNYSPLRCYNQSKLANVLFAYEFAKRFKDSGVTAVSLHPGLVRTELMRHADLGGKADIALGFIAKIFFPFWYIISKSAKEGAQTTIHCAIDDSVLSHNGSYYADCKTKQPGYQAYNDADAKQLWDLSCELVKL